MLRGLARDPEVLELWVGETVVWGTGPIGALLGGTLGQLFGLRAALLITGVAYVLVFPIIFGSSLRTLRDLPSSEAVPA
jgi:hypothetical protein